MPGPSSISSTDVDEPTVVVGAITKAHGLRGEVAVEVRSDNPDRFVPGSEVFTEAGRRLQIERAAPHGARYLVTFKGLSDRTEAESLRGTLLVVPESWLPDLPEGEYWPFQLTGCAVQTESGREIGVVSEVIPNAANDLWVAVDEAGNETLIPALRTVVARVDLEAKRILVHDVAGITAPDED
jgi:16S rRNA processing protein RimM